MNITQLQQYAANRNVRAFLDTIAYGEGANYNTLYGGGVFSGNQHPCRKIKAGRYTSDAAGRYQFLCSTWRGLVSQYGFSDFSPANQDLGAIALIAQKGGLDNVVNGDLQGAVNAIKGVWPSAPGGSQQTRTWPQYTSFFANAGGSTGAPPATSPNAAQTAAADLAAGTDSTVIASDYFGEQGMISPAMLLIGAAGIVLYLLFRE